MQHEVLLSALPISCRDTALSALLTAERFRRLNSEAQSEANKASDERKIAFEKELGERREKIRIAEERVESSFVIESLLRLKDWIQSEYLMRDDIFYNVQSQPAAMEAMESFKELIQKLDMQTTQLGAPIP